MNRNSRTNGSSAAPLSVADAIRQWADKVPAKTAFRFIKDDGSHDAVGYEELHHWALAISSALRREYEPGARAILMFPHGLDFIAAFLGCLYSGIVAVPVCSPRPNRPSTQVTGIIRNCQPRLVLSAGDFVQKREKIFRQIPELVSLDWMQVDVHRNETSVGDRGDHCNDDALALLQYTSGSTGSPKGVMVTHSNLAHNSALIRMAFALVPETRGVFWLPHYHDMGLIGSIIGTLYCGGSSVLMSPLALVRRPMAWMEAITQTRATITGGPDFSYAMCADRISPSQRSRIDLSSLEVAFSGAEPVRYETMEKFSEAFASCGFRREIFTPCYGLAEATLLVSSRLESMDTAWLDVDAAALERNTASVSGRASGNRRIVSCGRPLPGQEVRIVDPGTCRDCADGDVGEIWVHGASIAHGYWNNPEATQATFFERTGDADGRATFLRTGDLGFLHAGELYVTGRFKDLIIVRGRNLYPQDIECTARSSCSGSNGAAAAAFSLEVNGREELVLVLEIERYTREEQYAPLVQAVRQSVGAEHEVAVHAVLLVRTGAIPRTSSGKLRRSTCREHYLAGALETLYAWVGDGEEGAVAAGFTGAGSETPASDAPGEAEIAAWLTSRIAELTSLPPGDISPGVPFASFGLSSLQGVMLAEQLQTFVGREIPATWIYNYPTITELARRIGVQETVASTADEPAGGDEKLRREIGELSIAQLEALVAGSMTEQSVERS
jgi:acyl-CoA synthetase (AMP-forming)/AMP-acid ligase II